jgi:hypothetical protein
MLPRRRSNERMRGPVLDATTKRFVFEILAWKIDSSLTDPVRSGAAAMTKARTNRRPPRLRRGSLRSQEFCKSQRGRDLPPRSGWRASDATSDEENPTVGRSRKQGRRKPSREQKRVGGYVSRRVLKLDGEEDLFCTPFREERICVLDEEAPHWDVEDPCTPRTPPQAPIRLQQNPFSPTSRRIRLRILSSVSLRLFSAAGWLKKSRRQRHAERKSDGGEVLEDSWHGEEDVAEVSERDEGDFINVPLLAMQQMRIRADSETFRAQATGARSDPCVPTRFGENPAVCLAVSSFRDARDRHRAILHRLSSAPPVCRGNDIRSFGAIPPPALHVLHARTQVDTEAAAGNGTGWHRCRTQCTRAGQRQVAAVAP